MVPVTAQYTSQILPKEDALDILSYLVYFEAPYKNERSIKSIGEKIGSWTITLVHTYE